MSRLTDFDDALIAPDKTTVYTAGASGYHQWIGGARIARVTVVAAGGAGGISGKYFSSPNYFYDAGGGGGAGAMARGVLQLDPAGSPSVPYAVGSGATNADGGSSYFGAYLFAEGGKKGANGSNTATRTPGVGGAEAGRLTQTIYTDGSITQPRLPCVLPGMAGAAGVNGTSGYGGAGGSTLYGHGGAQLARPSGATDAPLAGNAPTYYGCGAGGGSGAPTQTVNHTVPASVAGGGGAIILEEWA